MSITQKGFKLVIDMFKRALTLPLFLFYSLLYYYIIASFVQIKELLGQLNKDKLDQEISMSWI